MMVPFIEKRLSLPAGVNYRPFLIALLAAIGLAVTGSLATDPHVRASREAFASGAITPEEVDTKVTCFCCAIPRTVEMTTTPYGLIAPTTVGPDRISFYCADVVAKYGIDKCNLPPPDVMERMLQRREATYDRSEYYRAASIKRDGEFKIDSPRTLATNQPVATIE